MEKHFVRNNLKKKTIFNSQNRSTVCVIARRAFIHQSPRLIRTEVIPALIYISYWVTVRLGHHLRDWEDEGKSEEEGGGHCSSVRSLKFTHRDKPDTEGAVKMQSCTKSRFTASCCGKTGLTPTTQLQSTPPLRKTRDPQVQPPSSTIGPSYCAAMQFAR